MGNERCYHDTQWLADHSSVKLGWPEESSLLHLMCLTGRYHWEMDSISPPRRKKYLCCQRMTQTGVDARWSPSLSAAEEALTQHNCFRGCILMDGTKSWSCCVAWRAVDASLVFSQFISKAPSFLSLDVPPIPNSRDNHKTITADDCGDSPESVHVHQPRTRWTSWLHLRGDRTQDASCGIAASS